MSSNPEAIGLFLQAADVHQKGELEEAKRLYENALRKDAEMVDSLRNLGALLRQLGKPDEALKYHLRALKL